VTGFQLSARAAAAEARWAASRPGTAERRDIQVWRGGLASTENADNFRTNQVTVADFNDTGAARGAGIVGISATWACVTLLAGTIASLPLVVYRDRGGGVREVARDHPLFSVLHDSAAFDWTAYDFWEFAVAGLELQGNCFARVVRDATGRVESLIPLSPHKVRVAREGGRLIYRWSDGQRSYERGARDVLHVRGPMGDELGGVSTLATCAHSFGIAASANEAASGVFRRGIHSPGTLMSERDLNAEQMSALEQRLHEKYAGAMNAGRPLILNAGLKWQALGINPDDAQMLESRQFSVEEICRIFGIPPHMVGHTANSTSWGTGLEQQTLGFVKFSLRRRLKRIEQALSQQLLTIVDRRDGISIEFNLEGLLRGDSESRAKFYESGLRNGWRTVNEVRALENLPPVPGGDVPRVQMQNVPLGTTAENDDAA